jgi:hypothetical protein
MKPALRATESQGLRLNQSSPGRLHAPYMPILAREDGSLAKAIAQAEPNHRTVTKVKFGFPGACARKAISYDIREARACGVCSTTTWVWPGLVKHKLAGVCHMASQILFEGGRSTISSSTPLPPSLPPPLVPSIAPSSILFLHPFFQLTVLDGGPLHLLPATHAMQGYRRVISGRFHRPVPASLSELRRAWPGYTMGFASPDRAPHQHSLLGSSCLEALQIFGQPATTYTKQQIQVLGIEPETFSVLG